MKNNLKTFATDEEYYADKEFLTHSMLKDFMACNYLFEQKHIEDRFPFEDADYFLIGRALDTLMTEGKASFKKKFEVVKRRYVHDSNVQQLTMSMYETVLGMSNELKRQPLIRQLQLSPQKCQEVIAIEIDGLKRKGKMDYFNLNKKLIWDLKTTADILSYDPNTYLTQLAYYKQLVRARYGIEAECHIAAVDKIAGKYRFHYHIFEKKLLDEAEERINKVLEDYKKSVTTNKFSPPISRLKCFGCRFYSRCDKAIQTKPTIIHSITTHL